MRIGVDPQRGLHRAAAVLQGRRHGSGRTFRNQIDKPAGEEMPDLVESDIAVASCRRLREFAEHHQFRQRRHRANLPDLAAVADCFDQFRIEEERQAFVADHMVMGADIFVARVADQDRSRHQLVETPAAMAAEAALADIGDRMAGVLFRERLVARLRRAAEVGHGNTFALQQRRSVHRKNLGMRARRCNRQQHVEQRLAGCRLGALDREQPSLGNDAAVR